jgi:hypothetical protein
MALASLDRMHSPSPTPRMRGEPRRAPTRTPRFVRGHHGDPVGADDLAKRGHDGPGQALTRNAGRIRTLVLVMGPDQMGQHFGVRLGEEAVPGLHQPPLQRLVILDDAVVHDGDPTRAVQVGVGILVGRRAVRRPTRVSDAGRAGDGFLVAETSQAGVDAAGPFAHLHPALAGNAQARAVIAAVFEAAQSFEKNGNRVLFAEIANDATHGCLRVESSANAGASGGRVRVRNRRRANVGALSDLVVPFSPPPHLVPGSNITPTLPSERPSSSISSAPFPVSRHRSA